MILWINLVTDSLPAISLGLENSNNNVMKEKPRNTNGSLFEGRTGKNILIHSLFQTILVMSAFCIGEYVFNDAEGAMTMAFVTVSFIQIFHAYNCRNQAESLFSSNPFKNTLLNFSAIFGIMLVLLITNVPVLEMFFGIRTLTIAELGISLGFALAIIPIVELHKVIIRAIKKSKKRSRR
jgi:Ca2+-transporting ATPase